MIAYFVSTSLDNHAKLLFYWILDSLVRGDLNFNMRSVVQIYLQTALLLKSSTTGHEIPVSDHKNTAQNTISSKKSGAQTDVSTHLWNLKFHIFSPGLLEEQPRD